MVDSYNVAFFDGKYLKVSLLMLYCYRWVLLMVRT
jgi:hypothetical protein